MYTLFTHVVVLQRISESNNLTFHKRVPTFSVMQGRLCNNYSGSLRMAFRSDRSCSRWLIPGEVLFVRLCAVRPLSFYADFMSEHQKPTF